MTRAASVGGMGAGGVGAGGIGAGGIGAGGIGAAASLSAAGRSEETIPGPDDGLLLSRPPIAAVILAGGAARRMGGGDKPLKLLGGKPILDHVIARIRPQARDLLLNVNGDPARFAQYDLTVVADVVPGGVGPLAGVLTALEWAQEAAPDVRHVVSVAADTPFLPLDLTARLRAEVEMADALLACATSGGRSHPVFGLWSVALADNLRAALVDEGVRKIDQWTARHDVIHVDWPATPRDPFFNVNRPEDLDMAERLLASGSEA